MTTKPPSKIKLFPDDSLEKIAYQSVESIPTAEPNDAYRLAYNVYQCLLKKDITLREAVKIAGARLLISEDDVYNRVKEFLKEKGITIE